MLTPATRRAAAAAARAVLARLGHGLSIRDMEAALAEALRDHAAVSKSTVSAVCGQIKDEHTAWARRGLDGITLG